MKWVEVGCPCSVCFGIACHICIQRVLLLNSANPGNVRYVPFCLQVKMRELGVTTHADYKITCMLDHRAMITVQTEKYGGCPVPPSRLMTCTSDQI